MSRISLTASMRSNLLSLQNISRQVSSTQNKLATGNKVNSAIDNPSSYYTARSLNNRADDLNALLDSMGQAVSTIKAATTALEAGADFLEQAAAVASQALEGLLAAEGGEIPAGAVIVRTESDLRAALANSSNQEVVIAGDIALTSKIELAEGQKLSGIQAYDNAQPAGRLVFDFSADTTASVGIELGDNSRLSSLNIEYQGNTQDTSSAVNYAGNQTVYLHDLNIKGSGDRETAGIVIEQPYCQAIISGNINMDLSGKYAYGIIGGDVKEDYHNVVQQAGSIINANLQGISESLGVALANMELNGTLNVTVPTEDEIILAYAILDVPTGGRVNLSSTNTDAWAGKFAAGAVVMNPNGIYQTLNYMEGAFDPSSADFQRIGDYDPSLLAPAAVLSAERDNPAQAESFLQYQQILRQYDSLIKDAAYKGINLLQTGKLNVKFNEKGSADLNVSGKDMSAAALGMQTTDWQKQVDVAQSLAEISAALKSIRNFSAELGNNYSIITSRQDFTENLINILTEGADKLTLADMNEESANMLALQTRQQLAVNSLSLASQASQAVLKLF